MNKNDLIQKLADTVGLAKHDAAKGRGRNFRPHRCCPQGGGRGAADRLRRVRGSRPAPAGKGRNPQTGEEITIKPSKQPRFRAGKQLKDSLN